MDNTNWARRFSYKAFRDGDMSHTPHNVIGIYEGTQICEGRLCKSYIFDVELDTGCMYIDSKSRGIGLKVIDAEHNGSWRFELQGIRFFLLWDKETALLYSTYEKAAKRLFNDGKLLNIAHIEIRPYKNMPGAGTYVRLSGDKPKGNLLIDIDNIDEADGENVEFTKAKKLPKRYASDEDSDMEFYLLVDPKETSENKEGGAQ